MTETETSIIASKKSYQQLLSIFVFLFLIKIKMISFSRSSAKNKVVKKDDCYLKTNVLIFRFKKIKIILFNSQISSSS
jgi:hypothetical protein